VLPDTAPQGRRARSGTWMLYGAAGHTGALIARHARARGHRPLLAGRNASALAATAEPLDLTHRALALDDAAALTAALADVDLVLNAAGPFLHTAAPLAAACIEAGVHYLDIGNELHVFRTLYPRDEAAREAAISVIPGVGFGVTATNGLAAYVSEAVGGARELLVATRIAALDPGPGAAVTMRENLPFGGWVRRDGHLVQRELFAGAVTIDFPDGSAQAVPVPTGDLEAAFLATGAADITAYAAQPASSAAEGVSPPPLRSFAWARATAAGGASAEAILETGDSYAFTAAASVLAVERALAQPLRGVLTPATAFGNDLPLAIAGTTRTDVEVSLLARRTAR
jgi:short subunit dehydrogenase-like uncharacterized protein